MTQEKDREVSPKKAAKHEKKIKSKAKIVSGIASFSFLISIFDKLSEIFCDALSNGFWGRICSGYTNLQDSFEHGFLKNFLFSDRRAKKIFRRIRKFLSSHIENCFIATGGKRMISFFSSAPLNYYGNLGFFFGLYIIVAYFIRMIVPAMVPAGIDYLVVGTIILISSIPLLFSRLSISDALLKSSLGKLFVRDCLGISDETLARNAYARKGKGNIMLFFGFVAGVFTLFIHPLKILIAIFSFVIIMFVAVAPEIGVLLTVFMVPFFSFMSNPTITLCICVLTTAFFYTIKLIRGKRIFKLELVDGIILLFGIIVYFASVFSAGGDESKNAALVSCTLIAGYFLLVNLMRTEIWIKRCVAALVSSAGIVAAIGVCEYFFGTPSNKWLDTTLFTDIRVRVVSVFENPNVLATFLVMIFPFVLSYIVFSKTTSEKLLSLILCVIFVMATVFTWSRGAWIAMVASALIFFTIYTQKTLRIFGALILAIPAIPILLPDIIIDRALSILNFSDSSISYRLYTWIGSVRAIKDHWIGGIGFGSEAFRRIYPEYAYSGMEAAEHSHSLFLQILLGLGIGGILTFGVLLFLYFQKCSEYIKNPENKQSKFYTAAAVSSIIGALIIGIFDYIWFNYRVFFIFWIIMAIGCAFVRVGNNEKERKSAILESYQTTEHNKFD